MEDGIPLHDFTRDDDTSVPFKIVLMDEGDYHEPMPIHRHNYFEVFIFETGTGTHTIDFEDYEIKGPCMHFVIPGQVHQIRRNADSHGYVVLFSRDFLLHNFTNKQVLFELPFLSTYADDPTLYMNDEEYADIRYLVRKLRSESQVTDQFTSGILRTYLRALLLQAMRLYKQRIPDRSSNRQATLLHQFHSLLEQHYREEHQVQYYAQLLHTTPKTLNETCKHFTDRTASDIIFDRLILEAKRLLLHSELSTKEISYFLNYQDPAHFSKFFKNRTGTPPSALRRSLV